VSESQSKSRKLTKNDILELLERGLRCEKYPTASKARAYHIMLIRPSVSASHKDLESTLIMLRDYIEENKP